MVGRYAEIDRVVQIPEEDQNNPVLIGEPGVGKTAIAEGLPKEYIGDIPLYSKTRGY